MPSSSSGAIMAKTGNLAGAHDSRHLALRRQCIHKAQSRLRRHRAPPCDARELARKAGSIGIANRQDKVHAFVGRQGYGLIDHIVSPVAPERAAAEKHALGGLDQGEPSAAETSSSCVCLSPPPFPRPGCHRSERRPIRPHQARLRPNKARVGIPNPKLTIFFHNPSVRIGGINR